MAEDILPPSTEEKLAEQEIIRQALEEKTKQAKDYHDQLLRSAAEFDNYRKRVEKEKTRERHWGKQEILSRVIHLYDGLVQGKALAALGGDKKTLQGLELICKEFESFLKTEGVQVIEALGSKFDPQKHEAVERVPTEEHEEDTILEEVQRGYFLDGQLLRPARVKVAVKKQS